MDCTVEVYATQDLSEARREAIVDLCNAAHETEEFHKLFARYIPLGGGYFLGYVGDTLVSHAVVTTRRVQPAGLPVLRTAFVDVVSTLPRFQGQGGGSVVMRRARDPRLRDRLSPDRQARLLRPARVGAVARTARRAWHHGARADPRPTRRLMVLPLLSTPPLDLDASLTVEVQADRIWE